MTDAATALALPNALGPQLAETQALLDELAASIDCLDNALLTGPPHRIADAAAALKAQLAEAETGFANFRAILNVMDDGRLGPASILLYRSAEPELGIAFDKLRDSLRHLATRSDAGLKRALSLSNTLAASLDTLRALGLGGCGHLLAEA